MGGQPELNLGDFLPAFFADDRIHGLFFLLFADRTDVAIIDVVDPPEELLAICPFPKEAVLALQIFETFYLFPYRGQRVIL